MAVPFSNDRTYSQNLLTALVSNGSYSDIKMGPREIPGFYYDNERKKYFKILPNHVAPKDATYSRGAISRRRRERRKIKDTEITRKNHNQQRILRAYALRPAFSGGNGLQRELGLYRNAYTRQDVQARVFTKNVVIYESNRHRGIINLFEACPEHDMLLSALHWRLSRRELYAIQASQLFGPTYTDNEEKRPVIISPGFESEVSSIQITANGLALATTLGDRTPPVIQLYNQAALRSGIDENSRTTTDRYYTITPDFHTTFFCASANQHVSASPDKILLGAKGELFELVYSYGAANAPVVPVVETGTDVLALSWISANVASAGLRDGRVLLWDHRSRGSALRLRHSGTVCSLQQAETENFLLVAGLQNSFSMYDLRMPRIDININKILRTTGPKFKKNAQCSQPFLQFNGYENTDRYPIGMDFCKELGIVAVSQGENHVGVFSRNSGECIGSTYEHDKRQDERHPFIVVPGIEDPRISGCLRFVEGSRGEICLFTNRGGDIQRFMWSNYQEE